MLPNYKKMLLSTLSLSSSQKLMRISKEIILCEKIETTKTLTNLFKNIQLADSISNLTTDRKQRFCNSIISFIHYNIWNITGTISLHQYMLSYTKFSTSLITSKLTYCHHRFRKHELGSSFMGSVWFSFKIFANKHWLP